MLGIAVVGRQRTFERLTGSPEMDDTVINPRTLRAKAAFLARPLPIPSNCGA